MSSRSFVAFVGCVLLALALYSTPLHAQPSDNLDNSPAASAPADFPPDPPSDIDWSGDLAGWSDVVAAFNNARERESALLGITLAPLVFPSAESWEAMSSGEKVLWLVNEERTARGLAPLDGLEPNVNQVAQEYAEWLLANGVFSHDADGRSPWERLQDNVAIGACQDFLGIAENLFFAATSSSTPIPWVVEQAIYLMIYDDSDSGWGHRHAILWASYSENSGAAEGEGFLGVGHAHGGYTSSSSGTFYQHADFLVMNFFDPCATWGEDERATPVTPIPTPSPAPTATPTASPTPIPSPAPAQSRTVSGRVTASAGNSSANDTSANDAPAINASAINASAGQANQGLAAVIVASNSGQSTQTDANGDFVLPGLSPARHTLTLSKEGYIFSPSTIEVDLTEGDLSGLYFSGTVGPAGTDFSFSLHMPLILPAR